MDKFQQFLIVMAALSTSAQTLTEHLIKKRWATKLDVPLNDLVEEGKRQSKLHLYSGIIGAVLAAMTGLRPLSDLVTATGQTPSTFLNSIVIFGVPVVECVLVGVLVSYGGSFFNELLGVLREFKSSQAELKKVAAQSAAQPAITPTQPAIASAQPTVVSAPPTEGAGMLPNNETPSGPDFDSTLPPLTARDAGDVETQPYPDSPGDDMKDDGDREDDAEVTA